MKMKRKHKRLLLNALKQRMVLQKSCSLHDHTKSTEDRKSISNKSGTRTLACIKSGQPCLDHEAVRKKAVSPTADNAVVESEECDETLDEITWEYDDMVSFLPEPDSALTVASVHLSPGLIVVTGDSRKLTAESRKNKGIDAFAAKDGTAMDHLQERERPSKSCRPFLSASPKYRDRRKETKAATPDRHVMPTRPWISVPIKHEKEEPKHQSPSRGEESKRQAPSREEEPKCQSPSRRGKPKRQSSSRGEEPKRQSPSPEKEPKRQSLSRGEEPKRQSLSRGEEPKRQSPSLGEEPKRQSLSLGEDQNRQSPSSWDEPKCQSHSSGEEPKRQSSIRGGCRLQSTKRQPMNRRHDSPWLDVKWTRPARVSEESPTYGGDTRNAVHERRGRKSRRKAADGHVRKGTAPCAARKTRTKPCAPDEPPRQPTGDSFSSPDLLDVDVDMSEHHLCANRSECSLVQKRDSWIWFSPETRPSVENFASRQRKFKSQDPRVAELVAEIRRQDEMNRDIERTAESLIDSSSPSTGKLHGHSATSLLRCGRNTGQPSATKNRAARKNSVAPYSRPFRKTWTATSPQTSCGKSVDGASQRGHKLPSSWSSSVKFSPPYKLSKPCKAPSDAQRNSTMKSPLTYICRKIIDTEVQRSKTEGKAHSMKTAGKAHSMKTAGEKKFSMKHAMKSFPSEQKDHFQGMKRSPNLKRRDTETQCSKQSARTAGCHSSLHRLTKAAETQVTESRSESSVFSDQTKHCDLCPSSPPAGHHIRPDPGVKQQSPGPCKLSLACDDSVLVSSAPGSVTDAEVKSQEPVKVNSVEEALQSNISSETTRNEATDTAYLALCQTVDIPENENPSMLKSHRVKLNSTPEKPNRQLERYQRRSKLPVRVSNYPEFYSGLTSRDAPESQRLDELPWQGSSNVTPASQDSGTDLVHGDMATRDSNYRQGVISKEVNTTVQKLLFDNERSTSSRTPSCRSIHFSLLKDDQVCQHVDDHQHGDEINDKNETSAAEFTGVPPLQVVGPQGWQTEEPKYSDAQDIKPSVMCLTNSLEPKSVVPQLNSDIGLEISPKPKRINIYTRNYYLGKRVASKCHEVAKPQPKTPRSVSLSRWKKTDITWSKTVSLRFYSPFTKPILPERRRKQVSEQSACALKPCIKLPTSPTGQSHASSAFSDDSEDEQKCSPISIVTSSSDLAFLHKPATDSNSTCPMVISCNTTLVADVQQLRFSSAKPLNRSSWPRNPPEKNSLPRKRSFATFRNQVKSAPRGYKPFQSGRRLRDSLTDKSVASRYLPITSFRTKENSRKPVFCGSTSSPHAELGVNRNSTSLGYCANGNSPKSISGASRDSPCSKFDISSVVRNKSTDGEDLGKAVVTVSKNNSSNTVHYPSFHPDTPGKQELPTQIAQFLFVPEAKRNRGKALPDEEPLQMSFSPKNIHQSRRLEGSCTSEEVGLSSQRWCDALLQASESNTEDLDLDRQLQTCQSLDRANENKKIVEEFRLRKGLETFPDKSTTGHAGPQYRLDKCRNERKQIIGRTPPAVSFCGLQGMTCAEKRGQLEAIVPRGEQDDLMLMSSVLLPATSSDEEDTSQGQHDTDCDCQNRARFPRRLNNHDFRQLTTSTVVTTSVTNNVSNPDSGFDESISDRACLDFQVQMTLTEPSTLSLQPHSPHISPNEEEHARGCRIGSSSSDESHNSDAAHRSNISNEFSSEGDNSPTLSSVTDGVFQSPKVQKYTFDRSHDKYSHIIPATTVQDFERLKEVSHQLNGSLADSVRRLPANKQVKHLTENEQEKTKNTSDVESQQFVRGRELKYMYSGPQVSAVLCAIPNASLNQYKLAPITSAHQYKLATTTSGPQYTQAPNKTNEFSRQTNSPLSNLTSVFDCHNSCPGDITRKTITNAMNILTSIKSPAYLETQNSEENEGQLPVNSETSSLLLGNDAMNSGVEKLTVESSLIPLCMPDKASADSSCCNLSNLPDDALDSQSEWSTETDIEGLASLESVSLIESEQSVCISSLSLSSSSTEPSMSAECGISDELPLRDNAVAINRKLTEHKGEHSFNQELLFVQESHTHILPPTSADNLSESAHEVQLPPTSSDEEDCETHNHPDTVRCNHSGLVNTRTVHKKADCSTTEGMKPPRSLPLPQRSLHDVPNKHAPNVPLRREEFLKQTECCTNEKPNSKSVEIIPARSVPFSDLLKRF